jgi:two-component system, chemotaxis family, protein-glutamate methylesterase/glutaminase
VSAVLVASPSTFLRIGLVQQLRRRRRNLQPVEAASAAEALRILAESVVALAIVDDALMAGAGGEALGAALRRHAGRALRIATSDPVATLPSTAGLIRVIAGAIDGVLNMGAIARALPEALDDLAAAPGLRRPAAVAPGLPAARRPQVPAKRPEIILVAASTGGPGALATLLGRLGTSRLPMIIAQHMPADQTASFARHLAAETGLDVRERSGGDVPPTAHVTVLRGGSDYSLGRAAAGRFRLVATDVAGSVFHPSADLLFGSAAEAGVEAIAVVLSGMGEDGARGASAIAARGGRVLVQDFASCVVAGMPSATRVACPSASVATVPAIAEHLSRWTALPRGRLGGEAESAAKPRVEWPSSW